MSNIAVGVSVAFHSFIVGFSGEHLVSYIRPGNFSPYPLTVAFPFPFSSMSSPHTSSLHNIFKLILLHTPTHTSPAICLQYHVF